MIAAERAAATEAAHSCFHCGSNADGNWIQKETADRTLNFCCSGCLTAYDIITGSGNESYYRLREEFAPKVTKQVDTELFRAWEKRIPLENGVRQGLFLVEGIHCPSCVWLNQKVLLSTPGVISASVQHTTGRAKIAWKDADITLHNIAETLAAIGYRLVPIEETMESASRIHSTDLLKKMTVAGFFAGNVMLLSIALYAGYFASIDRQTKNFLQIISFCLTIPVLLYSGSVFFKNAFHSIRNATLSMDILTATGITLAFSYSTYVLLSESGEVFFDSICFVIFIILTGRFIESRLRLKSLYHVENLRKRSPSTARVWRDGWHTLLIGEIQIGDTLRILTGEVVPADGVIRSASAETEESVLTGEARPIAKKEGDLVLSGVRALAEFEMSTVALPGDSTLARISQMAEDSLENTPATIRFTDLASRWFIAFALLAATGTFSFWFFYKNDPHGALLNTITLLIAACPCALSLAVPTVFTVAVQRAFANGCLLKNGSVLEILARTKNIGLDKTGTLTTGSPRISRIVMLDGRFTKEYAIALSARMQSLADVRHPISRAFSQLDGKTNLFLIPADLRARYLPGSGIMCSDTNHEYLLGNRQMMNDAGIDASSAPAETPPQIAIYLARKSEFGSSLIAVFYLSDQFKKEAIHVVHQLDQGYNLFMLTGDTHENAKYAATVLGIKEIFAAQTPENKRDIVSQKLENGITAMVGDGINDSIALARASVGISFASASEISLHTADVLLLRNDLQQLIFVLNLAKKARQRVVENLTMSFAYNCLLLPLACMGLIVPLAGALFMSLSSITVVLNSLRLKGT